MPPLDPMIRSIHAIGSPKLGGAERFFVRLVNALTADGYTSAAVLRHGSALTAELAPEVPRVHAGMRNSLDLLTVRTIRAMVREHRPDVVQTYLGRASWLTRVPRRSETMHVARLGGYYRPNSYRHADAWVANTRGIRDHLLQHGFPADRVFHVSNFAEAPDRPRDPAAVAATRAELGIPDDARVVFALGRFRPSKGFADLLEAFATLPREIHHRPLYLVIAGDGELRDELHAQAERLGIARRVRWTGWATKPDAYYAAADLFVCPSRIEHLGNVILEAWGQQVPLVSTRTRGAEELVEDGRTGLLVEAENPARMASVLEDALRGPEQHLRALADAGRDVLRARHSQPVIVAAYRDLYRHLGTLGRLGRTVEAR